MKEKITSIINSRYIIPIFIFAAIIIRYLFCIIYPNGLSADAQSYYISAINIVNGIGYSDHTESPFIPFYFREPLTSYFIAACIYLYKVLFNITHIDYPLTFNVAEMSTMHYNIILTIRIVNIILQVSAIYLFYRTIRKISPKIVACIFLMIACIYFPLIYNVIPLLREGYLLFFFSILFYFWVRYIQDNKIKYIIISSLSLGIITLLLHIYILLLIIFIPFIIYYQRSIKHKILHNCIFIILSYTPSLPWLYQVYQFYPDYRIIKTLGSGLSADYIDALNAYRAYGVNPYNCKQEEIPEIEIHPEIFSILNAKEVFENTFSGKYAEEANKIKAITPIHKIIDFKMKSYITAFENTVFQIGITYDYDLLFGNLTFKSFIKLLFSLPYIIMGILAMCGLYSILKRHWLLLPIFLFHALLFFALGSEERRQLALIPYIIWFAIIFIYNLYKKCYSIH